MNPPSQCYAVAGTNRRTFRSRCRRPTLQWTTFCAHSCGFVVRCCQKVWRFLVDESREASILWIPRKRTASCMRLVFFSWL